MERLLAACRRFYLNTGKFMCFLAGNFAFQRQIFAVPSKHRLFIICCRYSTKSFRCHLLICDVPDYLGSFCGWGMWCDSHTQSIFFQPKYISTYGHIFVFAEVIIYVPFNLNKIFIENIYFICEHFTNDNDNTICVFHSEYSSEIAYCS